MKVLVTGASGFLGGALTHVLVKAGHEVRILARPASNLGYLAGLPLDVRFGHLEDSNSLAGLMANIQIVYHCAARSSDWGSWSVFYQTNVLGVKNLLEAIAKSGTVQRLMHVSTTDVYGYPKKACDETFPITDVGLPYNRSKGLGEKLVWDFYQQTGIPVTIIRPASIYGERSPNFVAEIVNMLRKQQMVMINGGHSPAGLLYIDNAVEAILQAANLPSAVGQAYNLRDESNETWRQYFYALAEGLGTPPPRLNLPIRLALPLAYGMENAYSTLRIKSRPLLTRHVVYMFCRDQGYPIEKAQNELEFRSAISFDAAITRIVHWLSTPEGKQAVPWKRVE